MDPNQRSYPIRSPYIMYGALNARRAHAICMSSDRMPVADMNPHSSNPMADSMHNMMSNWSFHSIFAQNNLPMRPVRRIITLPNCVLYAPHPEVLKIKSVNENKPRSNKVFVGCLPENKTEELMREIFKCFGEIDYIKMSEQNYCYIRFVAMEAADRAVSLSKYVLKIQNKDGSTNSSRIYVYYVKDNNYNFVGDCGKERGIHQCQEQNITHLQTSLVPYSENEAKLLIGKLKNEETFKEGIDVLVSWLINGKCNAENFDYFFQMLQNVNRYVAKIINEKGKLDEELSKAKVKFQGKMIETSLKFNEITEVSSLCKLPRVWNKFNVKQKREINQMEKTALKYAKAHSDEAIKKLIENDMDFKDNEDCFKKTSRSLSHRGTKDLEKLKAEKKILEEQLQIALQETAATRENNIKIFNEMQERLSKKTKLLRVLNEEYISLLFQNEILEDPQETSNCLEINDLNNSSSNVTHDEICRMVSITRLLTVHPFGACIEYICSYLATMYPNIVIKEVENLMQRFPNIFKEQTSSSDTNLTKNWFLVVFNSE